MHSQLHKFAVENVVIFIITLRRSCAANAILSGYPTGSIYNTYNVIKCPLVKDSPG